MSAATEARKTAARAIARRRAEGLHGRAALAAAYQSLTQSVAYLLREGDGDVARWEQASRLVFDRWVALDEPAPAHADDQVVGPTIAEPTTVAGLVADAERPDPRLAGFYAGATSDRRIRAVLVSRAYMRDLLPLTALELLEALGRLVEHGDGVDEGVGEGEDLDLELTYRVDRSIAFDRGDAGQHSSGRVEVGGDIAPDVLCPVEVGHESSPSLGQGAAATATPGDGDDAAATASSSGPSVGEDS